MTPRPSPFTNDPKLQAVFDALDDYISGTLWKNINAIANVDPSGTTHSVHCADLNNKNSVSYTERVAGVQVGVSPTSATLGPGETQQFTATATNPDGTAAVGAFTWALTAGGLGAIDSATGLYTAPATIDAATVVSVTASIAPGNSWATASVSLQP